MTVLEAVHPLQAEDGVGGKGELTQVAQRLVALPQERIQLQRFLLSFNC